MKSYRGGVSRSSQACMQKFSGLLTNLTYRRPQQLSWQDWLKKSAHSCPICGGANDFCIHYLECMPSYSIHPIKAPQPTSRGRQRQTLPDSGFERGEVCLGDFTSNVPLVLLPAVTGTRHRHHTEMSKRVYLRRQCPVENKAQHYFKHSTSLSKLHERESNVDSP